MSNWEFGPMAVRPNMTIKDRLRMLLGQITTLVTLLLVFGWLSQPVHYQPAIYRATVSVNQHIVESYCHYLGSTVHISCPK